MGIKGHNSSCNRIWLEKAVSQQTYNNSSVKEQGSDGLKAHIKKHITWRSRRSWRSAMDMSHLPFPHILQRVPLEENETEPYGTQQCACGLLLQAGWHYPCRENSIAHALSATLTSQIVFLSVAFASFSSHLLNIASPTTHLLKFDLFLIFRLQYLRWLQGRCCCVASPSERSVCCPSLISVSCSSFYPLYCLNLFMSTLTKSPDLSILSDHNPASSILLFQPFTLYLLN